MKDGIVDQRLITARIVEGKPQHNVIYSAATGADGKIYLGLSSEMDGPGTCAQLIRYDPEADRFEDVADLAALLKHPKDSLRHPHSKIHTAICTGRDGKVYAATHMTAPPRGEDFYHYWHVYNDPARSFEGSHLVVYDPATNRVEDFGVVAPRAGCRWMTYNPEQEELYFTTFLRAHFIVVKLKTGEVKDLGRISQYDFMGPCYSASGCVFTSDCYGFLLRYSPKTGRIEKLPLKIPNAPWRNSDGNGLLHFLPGPDKIKLYGVSLLGQRIFEYDPTVGEHGKIRDYGTLAGEERLGEYPVDVPLGRTMAVGPDGRIYLGTKNYTGGAPGSHIVSVDIASGKKECYGRMQVEGLPPILTPVAATVGHNGDVYFTAEQNAPDAPLQLIIFNPNGVRKKLPAAVKERYRGVEVKLSDPQQYAYYFPSREENSIFVTRGTFVAQELGFAGRTPHIPRNECAITALARGNQGVIFGATSGGRAAHLFMYLPMTRRFMPLNTFGAPGTACRVMAADRRGRLYFGTCGEAGGRLYRYDAPAQDLFIGRMNDTDKGEFTLLYRPPSPALAAIEELNVLPAGEGIYTMAVDHERNRLYGLTWPGGEFFIYDIERGTLAMREIFAKYVTKRQNLSRAMVCANGDVYFSARYGGLIKYCPDEDAFKPTGMKIPVSAGREYLNAASALTLAADGTVYGGTYADGYLFAFDPKTDTLANLGKPGIESRVRALAVGQDGVVWGLCGAEEELVHLVRYDPARRDLSDGGMMRAKMPKTWTVHRADALVTGADGELYIGESDAISHLMIYHPPIEKR